MDILEKMSYVQQASEKNKQIESQIKQLSQEIQPLSMTKNVQEISNPSLSLKERLLWFVVSDIALGYVLSKILSTVFTLSDNGWMTESQSIAAGNVGYRMVLIDWPVGVILAIPLACLVTSVISKRIKRKNIQENELKQQDNARIATENSAIIEQNNIIQKRNRQIEEQINVLKQEQSLLKQDVSQKIPEYPTDYLLPEIAAFVINQIQSGKADSINQAIVHYMAAYDR